MEHLKGIEKLIEFLFKDVSLEYRLQLNLWATKTFNNKKEEYKQKGYNEEDSMKNAQSYVENQIFNISNIR